MADKLIIAAAGSGKTTHLVNEALKQQAGKVLITTYTQANEAEIRSKIVEINGFIPEYIVVQTWFSFLLKHGVRPYQGALFKKRISGFLLVNGKSGIRGVNAQGKNIYYGENTDFERYYFSPSLKIYTDKIAKFVIRSNEVSNGAVIDRLTKIYTHIFVDEVQDISGFDLDFLKLLLSSKSKVLLVGDPRQGTYSTNDSARNKQFRKVETVKYFFQDKTINLETDDTSLLTNYRCQKDICIFSNKFFPDFPAARSGNSVVTGHDGVFLLRSSDVEKYLKDYNPVQLRDSIRTRVHPEYHVMNFGESKGLSFDRVVVYPTTPFLNWLKKPSNELAPTSKARFYVAVTRARSSVAIVVDDSYSVDEIPTYIPH